MFGYIRIDKPEMKVREYERYRSAYCGLCRAMGRCTGCTSRMTLSYDFAFLLIFRTVLTQTKTETIYARCPVHPIRKRAMLETNPVSEYVACAAGLLSYYKCKDDLADEKGKKKLRARLFYPTAKRMRRRALKQHPELQPLDENIRVHMERIAAEEARALPTADHYAELSGALLREIFAFGLEGAERRIAETVGRHIGKWVYLMDAYDDLAEDREKGRFNPYLLCWEEDPSRETAEKRREILRVALLSELGEVEKATDLMEFCDYPDERGILQNILYGGMPRAAEAVLCGCTRDIVKKRDKRKGND